MSNGGFEAYLTSQGIQLERTPVGDKYVAQKIAQTGAKVGGEQSGHIIFPDRQPTGDGLVTMLEVLRVLKQSQTQASAWMEAYAPWPQALINVEVADRETWSSGSGFQSALAQAESDLAGRGRVNVRASGTQPMVRVMVEADEYELRDQIAERLIEALAQEAGGKVYSRVDLTHALGD
jgi:phosphoglucosamine mutase